VAIPDATREVRAENYFGAISFSLSDEDMARLHKVSSVFQQTEPGLALIFRAIKY
jgi:diketogulonate reductase-like aldo/keto reductase